MIKKFIPLNRLIVFFLSLGFLVLAFEVYTMHYKQLPERTIMWTPIVFGVVAGISGFLITLIFNRFSYYLFCILMIISIGVGTLGLYLHNKWRFPAVIDFLFHNKPFSFELLTTYTPVIAPSCFIAMGGIGLIIAIYEEWGKK